MINDPTLTDRLIQIRRVELAREIDAARRDQAAVRDRLARVARRTIARLARHHRRRRLPALVDRRIQASP